MLVFFTDLIICEVLSAESDGKVAVGDKVAIEFWNNCCGNCPYIINGQFKSWERVRIIIGDVCAKGQSYTSKRKLGHPSLLCLITVHKWKSEIWENENIKVPKESLDECLL